MKAIAPGKLMHMVVKKGITEHKVIVAGGRDFKDKARLESVVMAYGHSFTDDIGVSIISGMARGADRIAYEFARRHNIHCYMFPANWDQHGKKAGYMRNAAMVEFCDSAICFHDGKSRGTAHTIQLMRSAGKPVHVYEY